MKNTHVLFLCPHGAVKSVFGMTYFKALADKAGLNVSVENGGTDPDEAAPPKVLATLKQEGFDLGAFVPPLLTTEKLNAADIVVSIGCITADQVPASTRYIDWSDVPNFSAGFETARTSVYAHAAALVAELQRTQ